MPGEPVSNSGQLDTESEVTLGLLDAVQGNARVSQRSLARELGIALGLTNAYLKRCVRKGWIKASRAPANRYAYYLTPKGFAEKSRLTASYLARSLHFYREARNQLDALLALCETAGWRRVALRGTGELAEIAVLCAMQYDVDIVGVVDDGTPGRVRDQRTVGALDQLAAIDAVILTELRQPQAVYGTLLEALPRARVLVPRLLKVTHAPEPGAAPEPPS